MAAGLSSLLGKVGGFPGVFTTARDRRKFALVRLCLSLRFADFHGPGRASESRISSIGSPKEEHSWKEV